MQSKGVRGAVLGAVAAAAMLLAGAAQAALQDRDLDKNGVTDAFYDTDLNITWLRDANVNGAMSWDASVAWADGYSFGGYSDWRLPTSLNPDHSGPCEGFNCTGSEMGHLWYIELGNLGYMSNVGDFQNFPFASPATYYWSGTERALAPSQAWMFGASGDPSWAGNQGYTAKWWDRNSFAMAVRNGDVAAVPEPTTYALMLAGITALALARRNQRR